MLLMDAGGLRQYYRLEGQDDRPVLIFSHSLGCDHTQWDAQTAALLPHFRILRYDIRGHGASAVPEGDYSIEMLARDALAQQPIAVRRRAQLLEAGDQFQRARVEDRELLLHPDRQVGRGGERIGGSV